MSTILTKVQKFERETHEARREIGGRLVIAGVSLILALTIAYLVVDGFTTGGVLA